MRFATSLKRTQTESLGTQLCFFPRFLPFGQPPSLAFFARALFCAGVFALPPSVPSATACGFGLTLMVDLRRLDRIADCDLWQRGH